MSIWRNKILVWPPALIIPATQFAFPATDTFQIGRILYRVSAHYDKRYGGLKPKIERLLRRDLENIPKYSNALRDNMCYTVPVNIAYPAAGKEFE